MTPTLVPLPDGSVTSPQGFSAAAVHAGLKPDGAPDVALLVSSASCATAGVFTKNAVRAAPVLYDADLLGERPGRMRAVADRKSTRLNSSHGYISYAVFCLKKKKKIEGRSTRMWKKSEDRA